MITLLISELRYMYYLNSKTKIKKNQNQMFALPESHIENIVNAAINVNMNIQNNSRRVIFENLHQKDKISF